MAHLAMGLQRTRPISPSKLLAFPTCPLRYVLETERPAGRLATGPIALRGTVAHKLIEQFTGKPLPNAQQLIGFFHAAMETEIGRPHANPLLKFAFKKAGIAGVLSTEQVLSACRFIKKILLDHPSRLAMPSTSTSQMMATNSLGRERKFEDTSLDLSGTIDLVYADNASAIHVVDYKTGKVVDDAGQPRAEYLFQVAAYGVLVKRVLRPPQVHLELVGRTSTWTGLLDAGLEGAVLELLAELRHQIPRDIHLDAWALARPGKHCQGCTYRPSCPNYVDSLMNGTNFDERLSPVDIAGTVVETTEEGGIASLRLRTPKGKMASIKGLPTDGYLIPKTGTTIMAYGLRHFDDLTRAAFPANFYMYRADQPALSAFEAILKSLSNA